MTKNDISFDQSRDRFFQPFRAPRSEGSKALVADVLNQLQNYEQHFGLRERSRKEADQKIFEEAVGAVICDVVHRHLEDPEGKVAISLSNRKLGCIRVIALRQ